MDTQDAEDTKLYQPGELLSCDNVGPVNPKSFEGYSQTFIWRDTVTKRMFSYSDSEYLEGLEEIRLHYKTRGIRIMVICTDNLTTFKSRKVRNYYAKHGIERQSSTPGRTQSSETSRR